MTTNFDEQHRRHLYDTIARPISGFFIAKNRLRWNGIENKLEKGANIIVANHPVWQEDIAVLISIYLRQLYFTANKEVFDKKEFDALIIRAIKKTFGKATGSNINFFSAPFRKRFAKFIAANIGAVGTIPVNIYGTNHSSWLKTAAQYLLEDKAVVFPQYHKGHPLSEYAKAEGIKRFDNFKYGAFKLAHYMLQEHNKDIPLTPISIKGAKHISFPLTKIKVNIGEPHYISECCNERDPVVAFKENIEKRVVELYKEF
jgi:1-acyl-sn-glycerol-3-phosphate acyltransferase